MEVFSYSRLEKYHSCPAAFYRHYVLGMEEPATPALLLGKAAHATIEIAAKMFNSHGLNSVSTFKIAAEAVIGMSPVEIDPEAVMALVYKDVVAREFNPANKIEEHFEIPLDPDDPFSPSLQGYIDLYRRENGIVYLVDWKSNYKEYHPTDTFQLGLYALYLNRITGLPVRGNLVFLRTGNVASHDYSPADMEKARVWAMETACEILEKILQVQKGEDPNETFPVKHGEACEYCGWSMYCADGALNVPGEIVTHDQAQEIAKKIVLLESAADQLKSLLKPYVEACGPVLVDKKEFRFVEADYWKWTPKAIEAAFKALTEGNKNPFEFLTFNSKGVEKAGWTDDVIASFGAKKSVSRQFKLVKAGENGGGF